MKTCMEKLLTITIPSYNAERYLAKCLDSLLAKGDFSGAFETPDERLEIIVINDGSTDRTAQIAGTYASDYPGIVKLIDKENGGHGSGINTGIKHAAGKYFKVVDADDWVLSENLPLILDCLETETSDVIVTGYRTINEISGKTQSYTSDLSGTKVPEVLHMDAFSERFEQTPAAFQFHGLCYRTDFYRSLGISMTEKVYYEDQEYAVLPFLKAETICFLPYDLYMYRIGDEQQSVSYKNLDKRLYDMETVIMKLILSHKEASRQPGWTQEREQFFVKRLSIAAVSFFAATFVKAGDKKRGRKEAEELKRYLDETEPEVSTHIAEKYHTLQKAGKIPGLAKLYGILADSDFFLHFKKIWNR